MILLDRYHIIGKTTMETHVMRRLHIASVNISFSIFEVLSFQTTPRVEHIVTQIFPFSVFVGWTTQTAGMFNNAFIVLFCH